MAIVYNADPEYWERLDGRDFPKVSPKFTHAIVQTTLVVMLKRMIVPGFLVVTEARFRIGAVDGTDSWLLPDVAVSSVERRRALMTYREREEPPFSPEIVIEIRSPRERAWLREEKQRRYLATGALLVLDVDPTNRTIGAYTQHGRAHFTREQQYRDASFPWLHFDVADVFADLEE